MDCSKFALGRTVITRRALFQAAGAALASFYSRDLAAQEIKVRLMREFPKAQGVDFSPDGKKLAFLDWGAKQNGTYCVVEIETGEILFRNSYKYHRTCGFAGSDHLRVRELIPTSGKDLKEKLSIIDFHTQQQTEKVLSKGDAYFDALLISVSDQLLLAIHSDPLTHKRSFLSLVEFPDFREIAKESYAVQPRMPMTKIGGMSLSNDFDLAISPDRKILAYSYDHTLICRNAADLTILWTQQMDPPLKAHKVAISADGAHIAAFAVDSQWEPDQNKSDIFIYDGKTGSFECRMPVRSLNGSAISPAANGFDVSRDGKMFAIADVTGEKDTWVVKIHIHEVPNGKRLISILHDRIGNARKTKLGAYARVHFTSDGRFLVTSGINTKVWSLERSPG
jgi:hypothetical protein